MSPGASHTPGYEEQNVSYCGPDRASALSKGCLFDPMSFAWLPDACFDQDLILDFLKAEDWRWYLDMHMSKQADRAEVLAATPGDDEWPAR
ncbi:hypothetical protein NW762_011957 [Fusarium torreyae]|uniref:Uncharacterized protein n=1 Tax=Fusarium torreyae TaxID=1237075 RepID=A0A9W8RNC6_9HYPO|nr:hypothetical protein NW762_011957 [Fusarium torreyae]